MICGRYGYSKVCARVFAYVLACVFLCCVDNVVYSLIWCTVDLQMYTVIIRLQYSHLLHILYAIRCVSN